MENKTKNTANNNIIIIIFLKKINKHIKQLY